VITDINGSDLNNSQNQNQIFLMARQMVNERHDATRRSRIRYLSKKKFLNFKEFSEIVKIPKNSLKNSLNARV